MAIVCEMWFYMSTYHSRGINFFFSFSIDFICQAKHCIDEFRAPTIGRGPTYRIRWCSWYQGWLFGYLQEQFSWSFDCLVSLFVFSTTTKSNNGASILVSLQNCDVPFIHTCYNRVLDVISHRPSRKRLIPSLEHLGSFFLGAGFRALLSVKRGFFAYYLPLTKETWQQ